MNPEQEAPTPQGVHGRPPRWPGSRGHESVGHRAPEKGPVSPRGPKVDSLTVRTRQPFDESIKAQPYGQRSPPAGRRLPPASGPDDSDPPEGKYTWQAAPIHWARPHPDKPDACAPGLTATVTATETGISQLQRPENSCQRHRIATPELEPGVSSKFHRPIANSHPIDSRSTHQPSITPFHQAKRESSRIAESMAWAYF